jgi:hypothetical protein
MTKRSCYFCTVEPVPKLIDCALTRTVLDQALAVSQAFSLAKLRILRLLDKQGLSSKTEVLEQPQFLMVFQAFRAANRRFDKTVNFEVA